MKKLTTLALLSVTIFATNVAQANIQFYPPHHDVITVISQPVVDNFEIYSLAKARQSIDETQTSVHDQIKASFNSDQSEFTERSNASDAS